MKSRKRVRPLPQPEECGVWLDASQLKKKSHQTIIPCISSRFNPLSRRQPTDSVLVEFTQTKSPQLCTKQTSMYSFFSLDGNRSKRSCIADNNILTEETSPDCEKRNALEAQDVMNHSPTICRLKSSIQYLARKDLPKLAYQKLKGKSPGVIFLPGFASDMNAQKAVALEDFCKSLGHSFIRFDYTGCGNSEGNMKECTIGKWKKDVLSILDDVSEGPQILVGSSMGGWLMLLVALARPEKIAALVGVAPAADHFVTVFNELPLEEKKSAEEKDEWKLASKYSEEGFYTIPYSFIKEAENHCLLNSPIPITSPIRLIHGMKDEEVPWHVSMQIADRVLSTDVDVILRKHGLHRMSEKDDIKLLVYTIDDLIDKLTTLG
ncbi:palmitoyl-protein thioesterase ABHD10, mitochondrial isoform X1 [Engystomops pustulosus]